MHFAELKPSKLWHSLRPLLIGSGSGKPKSFDAPSALMQTTRSCARNIRISKQGRQCAERKPIDMGLR
eukprot:2829833-Pleurochrysis_carterae.AAC.1